MDIKKLPKSPTGKSTPELAPELKATFILGFAALLFFLAGAAFVLISFCTGLERLFLFALCANLLYGGIVLIYKFANNYD